MNKCVSGGNSLLNITFMVVTNRVAKYAGASYFVCEGMHSWCGWHAHAEAKGGEDRASSSVAPTELRLLTVSQPVRLCSLPVSAPSTVGTGTHSHVQLLRGYWRLELSFS